MLPVVALAVVKLPVVLFKFVMVPTPPLALPLKVIAVITPVILVSPSTSNFAVGTVVPIPIL